MKRGEVISPLRTRINFFLFQRQHRFDIAEAAGFQLVVIDPRSETSRIENDRTLARDTKLTCLFRFDPETLLGHFPKVNYSNICGIHRYLISKVKGIFIFYRYKFADFRNFKS